LPRFTEEHKKRERIIYTPEWIKTCDNAKLMCGAWLAAFLGFVWAFGKRRNEVAKLLRKDVWIQEGYLYVRFYVGKKRTRTASVDLLPYTKRKILKHKAMPYILEYLAEYDKIKRDEYDKGYLFPSDSARKATVTVHTKFKNRTGQEEIREYTYQRELGYINPDLVAYYVRKVNPNIWLHLGRHTVATRAAEEGATEYDIANILDVSPRTASKYVHHGTKLTEDWSKRVE
jgi:integrase